MPPSIDKNAALLLAEHIGQTRPAQGRQLAGAAQIARQLIVNLLGRISGQLGVVQQAQHRRRADPHFDQPTVDHEIAGDIP